MHRNLPNLLIVGVPKAGTSSLFAYLAQHDQICPSDRKELNYFDRLLGEPHAETVEEYAAHFRRWEGQRYRMEGTPSYFYGGQEVVDRIQRTLERPQLVLLLRDPATRLWSYYNFERSRGGLPKDLGLEEYVAACERLYRESPDGRVAQRPYRALAGGFYADHLEPWLDTFDDGAFTVVFFEQLVHDPAHTVAGLCRWLDIDADVAQRFEYEVVNKTLQYRNATVERMARTFTRRARSLGPAYASLHRRLRRQYNRLNRQEERRSMDDATKQQLEGIYAEANKRLTVLLSARGYTNLPAWLP